MYGHGQSWPDSVQCACILVPALYGSLLFFHLKLSEQEVIYTLAVCSSIIVNLRTLLQLLYIGQIV